jgi:hypothetical protein
MKLRAAGIAESAVDSIKWRCNIYVPSDAATCAHASLRQISRDRGPASSSHNDDAMMRGAEPMTVAELKRHIDRRFLTKRGFRRELKRELTRFATKDDLKAFATKDDLKRFATKDDLKRFATKDDLKRFATKDDLKRYATKDDFHELRDEMRRGFAEMRLGFAEIRRDFMQIVDEHERRITDLETMHRL